MCPLLETIRCESGVLQNLLQHQERLDNSQKALFSSFQNISLKILTVPEEFKNGLFKCRVIYSESIESVEFLPYQLPKIQSLKLVVNDEIEYRHKFADRSDIQKMFETRGDADDILIVKYGQITDTSYANIIFFDGKNWLTPEWPLLLGVQRAKLLFSEKKIMQANIIPADLPKFSKARLINAMIRFEDEVDLNIGSIIS
jgi:4-amino-4-deoxychorismate lyase